MTIETINVGTSPNDGTGSSLRTSFIICNNNFSYLNAITSNFTGNLSANITSTGNSTFANLLATQANILGGNISVTSLTATNVTGSNVTVSNLMVTSVTADTISAALVGNTSTTLTGQLTTNLQPNITQIGPLYFLTLESNANAYISSGNLLLVKYITRTTSNGFNSNLAANSNLSLSIDSTRRAAFTTDDINVNVTYTYTSLTTGYQRTCFIRNITGNTRYITLPNTNNNKASNLIPITANATATFTFTVIDTTDANVVVQIVN